jgi:two-component system cell cycle response regulator CtrA
MKTIDVIICRLRKKLAVAGVPKLIDTVWGCGYILRDPSPAAAVGNDEPRAAPAWLDRAHTTMAA